MRVSLEVLIPNFQPVMAFSLPAEQRHRSACGYALFHTVCHELLVIWLHFPSTAVYAVLQALRAWCGNGLKDRTKEIMVNLAIIVISRAIGLDSFNRASKSLGTRPSYLDRVGRPT